MVCFLLRRVPRRSPVQVLCSSRTTTTLGVHSIPDPQGEDLRWSRALPRSSGWRRRVLGFGTGKLAAHLYMRKKIRNCFSGEYFFLISARDDEEGCNDYSVCLSRASGRIFDNRYFRRKVNYWNYFRVSVLLVFLLSW